MKVRFLYLIFCLIIGISQSAIAEIVTLGQFPAPSPDGTQLVFSYRNDLWIVPIEGGSARRLTVHADYESYPRWSPDGKEIAFSSDRHGNDDIFVMNADGTSLKQLTFLSVDDRIYDWASDGKSLLFSSRRDFSYPSHRLPSLYQVLRDGGTPTLFMPDFGDQGQISPDGRFILYTEGRIDPFRKHYRGSGDADVWRYDRQANTFLKLTSFDGNDFYPLWSSDGNTVYFVSHRDGTANLWQMQPDGSDKKQLTFHKDDGVTYARIARKVPIIAYTRGFEIWTLNLTTDKYNPVQIQVPDDLKNNYIEWKTYSRNATEMALSPDEKYIASVVHGEIFISKNQEKGNTKAVRLTQTSAREHSICWVPGGDTLVYASDRNGQDDLFMLISADPAEKNLFRTLNYQEIQLTNDKTEETSPKASPDGRKIAFIRENDLFIMDRNGKNIKRLVPSWNEPEFSWSPDSKWLAFTMLDAEFNPDIFIISAEGGTPVNISRDPDDDLNPVWSADGKKLGFTSKRFDDTFDIWYVFLQKADHEKTPAEWEEEEEREKEAKAAKKSKSDEKKKDKKVVVKIDFKDIHKRLRRITSLPGSETQLAISPDGKTFIFTSNTNGKNDLWSVKWNRKELKQLTSTNENPSQLRFSKDGKKLYYLKSGGTFVSITPTGKDKKTIPFQARMEIDRYKERRQMFQEAWRVLNQNFYDPEFHGADWKALRQKYGTVIEKIALSDDFYTAVRMMLGELNASHLGIYPPGSGGGIDTGVLGLKFDDTYTGKGLKIRSVMPDGPCAKSTSQVNPGEILLSIDGETIEKDTNIFDLLNQKIGEKVQLRLAGGNKTRMVVVKPIRFRTWFNLEYDRWVQQKRELVDKLSKGKLGYLHIRGMGWNQLQQFQTELYSEAHGKQGLLIDVRFNGGGWITDYLLTMLTVKPHAFTIPRGGEKGYPQPRLPYYAWTKPIATLCNQYSYSNAEIFSHAVNVLGLGKVIGEPTPGFVISTGGTRLLDGSTLRMPFRGWYNLKTGLNQELNGAIPDYIVKVQPGDEAKGIDRQLEKAVEVLLEEIEAEK